MSLKFLKTGTILLKLFFISIFMDIVFLIIFITSPTKPLAVWLPTIIGLAVIEFIVFWVGIIMTYTTSIQLGIKTRVLGVLFGWIPIINFVMLYKIIKI